MERDERYRKQMLAGTPRDAAAAARWYRTAAARGHAKAAHALARLERLQELTTLGEQGQMGAQFKVSLSDMIRTKHQSFLLVVTIDLREPNK
jgi:TPR repeat protein